MHVHMEKASSSFLADHWLNILESLEDGLLVINPQGRVEFMNQGAAQLTGLSSAQATGQPATQLIGSNRWLKDLLEATRTSGVRSVQVDAELSDRWTQERPVRAAATMLVDLEGEEVGTLLTLHDLSYQRELESRARETDRLGQLEILLAGLAHEIKNPLSGMRGAAQLLAASTADAHRTRECTQIILGE